MKRRDPESERPSVASGEASNDDLVSVVIATRNRKDNVLRALASAYAQNHDPIEVLLIDDASEDDTVEAVRKAFPDLRVLTCDRRAGLIVNRNRGFLEARGKYVVSIDDDAYFSQADIVSRAAGILKRDSTIGAVAIPYIEPLRRRSLSSLASPFSGRPGQELRAYVGCAHAVRRDVALKLGGYREFFVHQHEERDLCLRMRDAGWRIVYGDMGPIVHMASSNRELDRMMYYGGRNQILFETLNAPFPEVLWRVGVTSLGFVGYRFSWKALPLKMRAIGAGLVESARHWRLRRPVRRDLYREHRKLQSHGSEPWVGIVPPPCHEIAAKPRVDRA